MFLLSTLKIKLNLCFVDKKAKSVARGAGEFKDSVEKDVETVVEKNNL